MAYRERPKGLYEKAGFLGYGVSPQQLYTGFGDKHELQLSNYELYECAATGSLTRLCGSVFKHLFYLIIIDIIENGVIFKLPPPCKRSYIEMRAWYGEDFKAAYRNGAFQDVDFLASNFTGYGLQFRMSTRYGTWCKRLYVSSKYRDRIIELTNRGKKW